MKSFQVKPIKAIKPKGFEVAEPEPEETVLVDFEKETFNEIDGVVSKFKQRSAAEQAQKEQNISTEYWFAVYFADQAQRDDFLRKVNLLQKLEDQYIDGETFAKAVGIEIERKRIVTPKGFRKHKGFDNLVI